MFKNYLSCAKAHYIQGSKKLSFVAGRGSGLYGALGNGSDLIDRKEFTKIALVKDDPVVSISTGWGHSAMVTKGGKLIICGRPYDFQTLLRLNTINHISNYLARSIASSSNSLIFGKILGYYPQPIVLSDLDSVKSVSASAGLTLALLENGDVFSFGLNRWHQCGIPIAKNENGMHIFKPTKIPDLPPIRSLDAGLQHSLALSCDGDVYSWGKGNRGQLGYGKSDEFSCIARKIDFSACEGGYKHLKFASVSTGFSHSAALSQDGDVYLWGKGMSNILDEKLSKPNLRVYQDQWFPRLITIPEGRKIKEICCSNFNIIMRATDETLWAQGLGEYDRDSICDPVQVTTDFQKLGEEPVHEIQPIKLSPSDWLKKGYNRVSLHTSNLHRMIDIPDPNNQSQFLPRETELFQSFDIVLHKGESYLKGINLKDLYSYYPSKTLPSDNASQEDIANSILPLLDFSNSWKHELVLFKQNS